MGCQIVAERIPAHHNAGGLPARMQNGVSLPQTLSMQHEANVPKGGSAQAPRAPSGTVSVS